MLFDFKCLRSKHADRQTSQAESKQIVTQQVDLCCTTRQGKTLYSQQIAVAG